MIPLPTQLSGAKFLADRTFALLADEPRVGKTGTAIIAADYVMACRILVVTTASGRPVWRRGFRDWSTFPRSVQIATPKDTLAADTVIVGWPSIADPKLLTQILRRSWDLLILDESHYAKNFEAKRTQAAYGVLTNDGEAVRTANAIASRAEIIWCLTGTPLPNSPADIYPMVRACAPTRLLATPTFPDVRRQDDFLKRYCIRKPKKIGHGAYARTLLVVIGGKNLEELRARLDGLMLLRTQKDVGITAPIYEVFPLLVSDRTRRTVEASTDAAAVLAAAEAGDTKTLDMHLGPLRRLTGEIKARAVVEAVKEEFDGGLDKIVLMAWHKDTMAILRDGLSTYGVVGIDGSSSAADRGRAEERFRHDPNTRVFVGQILAAGEAIDLSAANELLFVETSPVPKDMKQASLRITNLTQKRQPRIRVAVLEGSIDEALEAILLRKWSAIREVLS